MVVALGPVGGFHTARGQGIEKYLAVQGGPVQAVGKPVLQDQVLPLLQDGGSGVPVERVLEHHHLVRQQALLLAFDIDLKIEILGVQIDQRDAFQHSRGFGHVAVDFGVILRWVGKQHQHTPRRGRCRPIGACFETCHCQPSLLSIRLKEDRPRMGMPE